MKRIVFIRVMVGTVVMEIPGHDEGTGLNQARLVVHNRAWPLNLIGSGMYRKACERRKHDIGLRGR